MAQPIAAEEGLRSISCYRPLYQESRRDYDTILLVEADELRRRVAAIQWYQTIDLGGGIVTPGVDNTPKRLRTLGLPESLAGKTVLDIGAWDGFFSFEAERRGAARVVATDYFCWNGPGWGSKAGFELAREHFGSSVEDLDLDVCDLRPENPGVFDLVLFLGVLYHVENPMLALRAVRKVTGERLILETVCDWITASDPRAAYYPEAELNGDPTNWWGLNPAAVTGMLRAVGFRKVVTHYVQPPHERWAHAALKKWQGKAPFFATARQGRAVFHAWA
mgnify:CR=1 FL=1